MKRSNGTNASKQKKLNSTTPKKDYPFGEVPEAWILESLKQEELERKEKLEKAELKNKPGEIDTFEALINSIESEKPKLTHEALCNQWIKECDVLLSRLFNNEVLMLGEYHSESWDEA